jgi:hypothetical protein
VSLYRGIRVDVHNELTSLSWVDHITYRYADATAIERRHDNDADYGLSAEWKEIDLEAGKERVVVTDSQLLWVGLLWDTGEYQGRFILENPTPFGTPRVHEVMAYHGDWANLNTEDFDEGHEHRYGHVSIKRDTDSDDYKEFVLTIVDYSTTRPRRPDDAPPSDPLSNPDVPDPDL